MNNITEFRGEFKADPFSIVRHITDEVIDKIIKSAPEGANVIIGFEINNAYHKYSVFSLNPETLDTKSIGYHSKLVAFAYYGERTRYMYNVCIDNNMVNYMDSDFGCYQPETMLFWNEFKGWHPLSSCR